MASQTPKIRRGKIVFLTGMSGTGKSTILAKLSDKGYKVVDTDYDGWSIYGKDPKWGMGWIWDEERMKSLLGEHIQGILFISGTVSNQGEFYPYFDAVVLLSAPLNVMRERIENRSTNDYGKTDEEWNEIVYYKETVEPLLRDGADFEIDTRKPLNQTIEELENIASSSLKIL